MQTERTTKKIKIIGLPPSRDRLIPETIRTVLSADVVAGGRMNLDFFPEIPGKRIELRANMRSFIDEIASFHAKGKEIVVLTTGDPMIFGPVKNLLSRFDLDQLEIENTVSPLQLALARLGEDLEGALVLSLHGRRKTSLEHVFFFPKSFIYTDNQNSPPVIASKIIQLEPESKNWKVAVCMRLGFKDEEILHSTLGGIRQEKFTSPNILVVFNPDPKVLRSPESFGRPDDCFYHERGMITHPEVRSVTLSKLDLGVSRILWDVGAGSGSVALEATLLYPSLKAYGIEKDEKRFLNIRRNIEKFGTKRLEAVFGDILGVSDKLPDPDRVFLGGGGNDLQTILAACFKRLKPGGKLVANCITMESIATVNTFAKENGLTCDACCITVSRKKAVKTKAYMKGENPVTIFEIRQNQHRKPD